jgi:hypothetical protein
MMTIEPLIFGMLAIGAIAFLAGWCRGWHEGQKQMIRHRADFD